MKRLTLSGSTLLAVALLAACDQSGRPSASTSTRQVLVYAKPAGTGGTMQIWVSAPDGADPRLLANGDSPAVSPNGRYVAYVHGAYPQEQVRVIPTAGGPANTVGAGNVGGIVWSPNSRFLAWFFFNSPFAFLVDARSGKRLRVLKTGTELAFSPDSKQIAYGHAGSLWRVPIHGGKPVRLTGGLIGPWPVPWGKQGIAYIGGTSHFGLWLSGVQPHETRFLTHGDLTPVTFSADGTKLLAYAGDPTTYPFTIQLWAVDVPSGHAKALTGDGNFTPEGLSSSGTSVLVARCSAPHADNRLETIPFAGGKPQVLVRGVCNASWNAP